MAMKIYRQVTRTYMKTFVQKNSPFMDFEIWPKFSLEPLLESCLSFAGQIQRHLPEVFKMGQWIRKEHAVIRSISYYVL